MNKKRIRVRDKATEAARMRAWRAKLTPEQRKEMRDRINARTRERYANDPEFRRKVLNSTKESISKLPQRCLASLRSAKHNAKRRNHAPCITDVSVLIDSFTGRCHICDVLEEDLKQKLCMDHHHETGEFRGWLCESCNRKVGHCEQHLDRLVSYIGGSSHVVR